MTVPSELLVKALRAAGKVVSMGTLAAAKTVLLDSAPDGMRKPTRRGSINSTMSECLTLIGMRARTGRTCRCVYFEMEGC